MRLSELVAICAALALVWGTVAAAIIWALRAFRG